MQIESTVTTLTFSTVFIELQSPPSPIKLYLHTFNIRNIYSSNESLETSSGFITLKLDSTVLMPEKWVSSVLKPGFFLCWERQKEREVFVVLGFFILKLKCAQMN